LALQVDLVLEARQVLVPALVVDLGDHVGREVDDLLEVLRREVEEVAQAGGHALEVPDVGDGSGELDVAHALTADLRAGDLDATPLADDALVAHALVLAAVALPVPGGTEDPLAEQAVLLGLERAVVDRLGLLHLSVRPATDLRCRGQADVELVEDIDVEQGFLLPSVCHRVESKQGRRGCRDGDAAAAAAFRCRRRCWRPDDGTGRYRARRRPGTPPRRRHAARWRCPPRRVPRRSGTATASPS